MCPKRHTGEERFSRSALFLNIFSIHRLLTAAAALVLTAAPAAGAVYQWSAPVRGALSAETYDNPRAYLWIPPACPRVRAVVVGEHNLLEEPLLESPRLRARLEKLCIAEVWTTPVLDTTFDFNNGAGAVFTGMMQDLADASGYAELAYAPVVPVGESALASYPWNFAAWAPERTLAVISLKGDAPQTDMTGSGKPNPDWGARTLDGVPGLMIMGEYEWLEGRLAPALAYEKAHPKTPLSLYADPGHGHFDLSDPLIDYIGLFIEKAAQARLPAKGPLNAPPRLLPVDPARGWRADRWRFDAAPAAPAAPDASYKGPRDDSFWYFDAAMARLAEAHYAETRGKAPQLIGFVQDGRVVPQSDNHAQVELAFAPQADGVSFRLDARMLDAVPGGNANLSRWTRLPVGAPLGHADGPIEITRETGPVVRTGPDTWRVDFNRVGFNNARRGGDVWFVATQGGDARYKSAVQQALLHVPLFNTRGAAQSIRFEAPARVSLSRSGGALKLSATATSGLPVRFYVQDGPAEIDGGVLRFTPIPMRARLPIRVTVIAWQYGVAGQTQSATPVERTLLLTR